jgi:hypothetical protein
MPARSSGIRWEDVPKPDSLAGIQISVRGIKAIQLENGEIRDK